MICKNGHQQPTSDSRFCIYCGAPLNAQPVEQTESQYQTTATNPPPQNNYQQNPGYQNFQPPIQAFSCQTCGGDGRFLDPKIMLCPQCKWLRPLTPGYGVDCSAFQWAADGTAMSALRTLKPLTMAAEAISEKVGRQWIESMFNGVLLSEKQLPDIYKQAVKAARILGVSHMPDIYISGEVMWDCRTYGTDKDAFIVMGTALVANFRGPELLFLFAREMGHCRAGHALWKTVIKFLMGEQGPKKGLLAGGILNVLSPTAMIEGAIEVPLLGWARQAEITADRAGMLAIGDAELARRVLLSWSLKSPFLYKRINVTAWLEQQATSEDDMNRLSELMTSSTPYITRRLKLMDDFARSEHLKKWRDLINQYAPPVTVQFRNEAAGAKDHMRLKCSHCGTPMRVPKTVLEGKEVLSLRCPNAACAKTTVIKKNIKRAPSKKKGSEKMPGKIERNESYAD